MSCKFNLKAKHNFLDLFPKATVRKCHKLEGDMGGNLEEGPSFPIPASGDPTHSSACDSIPLVSASSQGCPPSVSAPSQGVPFLCDCVQISLLIRTSVI